MNCSQCGAPVAGAGGFCPSCGARIDTSAPLSGGTADRALDVLAHRKIITSVAWLIAKAPLIGRLAGQLRFEEFTSLGRSLVLGACAVAALLGFYPSSLGHIETTPFINIIMPIISCINPALGFASSVIFGICDFAEKMLTNNVYYEGNNPTTGDYIGARIGFLFSYTMVMAWGILPGMFSHALSRRVLRWAERRAQRRSLGAASQLTRNEQIMVAAAGGVGAAAGGGLANLLNLGLMAPAFLLRPTPDFTCYDAAWTNLLKGIWLTMGAGGIAGPVARTFVHGTMVPDYPEPEEPTQTQPPQESSEPPKDDYEAWWNKYNSMGWRFTQKDGEATFEPVDGAVDDNGWTYSSAAGGFVPPPGSAPPVPDTPTPKDGDVNADGEVWSDEDGGWIGRNLYEQEKSRAGRIAEIEARSKEATRAYDEQTRRLDADIARSARDRAARKRAEEARLKNIADKLSDTLKKEGLPTDEVERLREAGDDLTLRERYEETIRRRMEKTSADSEYWEWWSRAHGAGEFGSRVVLAGAKAGMMVVAGPAGYIPAAIGSGVIRSAEEGARNFVQSGGDKRALGKGLVTGFFAGAKDGVVGRFTGLPKTGTATKVFLPAATDATETYIRTGDIKASLSTGALSSLGGAAGMRFDAMGNVIGREGAHLATGTVLGAVGSAVNGGSISEGAINGLADSIGGRAGAHIGSANVPMTADEIQMDLEHGQKIADANERIGNLKAAIAGGDETKIRNAVNDVLDHREAKQIMKGSDIDDGLAQDYARLAREHRTEPVFEGTAETLNRRTIPGQDGTDEPRFVVRDTDGNERPVTSGDFASGSGRNDRPGMDLDMYPRETIIDRQTGQPAKRSDIDAAVTETCNRLGIDRHGQEINVTGQNSPEDLKMRPGEDPGDFFRRVEAEQSVTAAEGQTISEVTSHKLNEAKAIHGGGADSSLTAEQARIVMKDKGRLIDHIMSGDAKAHVPEVFRRQDAVTGDTPLSILQDVADGTMPPGTANAKFRRLTGMSIGEGSEKIASWTEALGKWGGGSGGTTSPPDIVMTGPGSASGLQTELASIVRETVEKKGAP